MSKRSNDPGGETGGLGLAAPARVVKVCRLGNRPQSQGSLASELAEHKSSHLLRRGHSSEGSS